jgi:hypothetical protein
MTKAGQLAVHAAVSPGRVLPRYPQHQVVDLLAGRRAARPSRVGPLTGDQTAVPGQQGSQRDHATGAQCGWQQPGQGCQDRAAGPVRPGPGDLAAEHHHLMTQDDNLRVLGRLAPAQQAQPSEHADRDQVQQTDRHEPRSCPNPPAAPNRSLDLHRVHEAVQASPVRPVQPVSPVSPGRRDDDVAQQPRQLRNGDRDKGSVQVRADVLLALHRDGDREVDVGEQADRGPVVPGFPADDLPGVQAGGLLGKLVIFFSSPATKAAEIPAECARSSRAPASCGLLANVTSSGTPASSRCSSSAAHAPGRYNARPISACPRPVA